MAEEIKTETVTLTVADGTTMPAYAARPVGDGPFPGILVFQEAFGVNAHIRDVTERFARAGYTAIAPALYHRTDPNFEGSYTDFGPAMTHLQALTDAGQSADIQASYDWLTSDGGVSQVVSTGYCMGGRTSFLADTLLPLKASASYYGGGIAPSDAGFFPDLLGKATDLKAPILLFWGGKDSHIGITQVRATEDALKAAEKNYVQVTFSQADHGFFCDARASYNPEAARQAWALTLEFFATYL
ncbi:MAG: dienelactone hydrolase family protein [Janthinobacterium lividum]